MLRWNTARLKAIQHFSSIYRKYSCFYEGEHRRIINTYFQVLTSVCSLCWRSLASHSSGCALKQEKMNYLPITWSIFLITFFWVMQSHSFLAYKQSLGEQQSCFELSKWTKSMDMLCMHASVFFLCSNSFKPWQSLFPLLFQFMAINTDKRNIKISRFKKN